MVLSLNGHCREHLGTHTVSYATRKTRSRKPEAIYTAALMFSAFVFLHGELIVGKCGARPMKAITQHRPDAKKADLTLPRTHSAVVIRLSVRHWWQLPCGDYQKLPTYSEHFLQKGPCGSVRQTPHPCQKHKEA